MLNEWHESSKSAEITGFLDSAEAAKMIESPDPGHHEGIFGKEPIYYIGMMLNIGL